MILSLSLSCFVYFDYSYMFHRRGLHIILFHNSQNSFNTDSKDNFVWILREERHIQQKS